MSATISTIKSCKRKRTSIHTSDEGAPIKVKEEHKRDLESEKEHKKQEGQQAREIIVIDLTDDAPSLPTASYGPSNDIPLPSVEIISDFDHSNEFNAPELGLASPRPTKRRSHRGITYTPTTSERLAIQNVARTIHARLRNEAEKSGETLGPPSREIIDIDIDISIRAMGGQICFLHVQPRYHMGDVMERFWGEGDGEGEKGAVVDGKKVSKQGKGVGMLGSLKRNVKGKTGWEK